MNTVLKKSGLVIPLVTVACFISEAQLYTSKFEAGISGGVFVYQGDLTPEPLGAYATIKPQFGLFASYILNRSFSVRGNFSVGSLKADDAKYDSPEYRKQRAFKFTSPVSEFSAMFVWDILRKNGIEGRRGFAPYIFAGAGISLLNIQRNWSGYNAAYFNSETVSEGLTADIAHRTPRALPVIPVGAGVKYFLSPKLAVKAETNYRFLSSDYLDGFSQAANPGKKDNYYSHSLGIVFSLGYKDRSDCPPKP